MPKSIQFIVLVIAKHEAALLKGIMDILLMASHTFFGTLRVSHFLEDFFSRYQHYFIATWCFNEIYVSIFLRCFGVLLISFQRYITICRNEWKIEQVINRSHRWVLPFLQWTVPLLYSIPLLVTANASFRIRKNVEVVVRRQVITLATSMAVFFVSTTFTLCCLCYGAILRFLIKNRYSENLAIKRERRLYMQMMGLFIGFVLFFIYSTMQFTFSLQINDSSIYAMRIVYPLISCFFSYVNAWTMFILNGDNSA
ncbi:hypothetical protein COOONC_18646 [Cooperia oncophora]